MKYKIYNKIKYIKYTVKMYNIKNFKHKLNII